MENEAVEQKLKEAIKVNVERASKDGATADEALKYTQAAVNAANAICTFRQFFTQPRHGVTCKRD